jgi:hypothetical protein
MGKNWCFDVCLYSVKDGEFHKSTNFSGLYNIQLNPNKKTITEAISEGCLSQCYTENTFKVINNKRIIIKHINQYFDSKKQKFRCLIEKYRKGKLISKKTTTVKG